MLTNLANHLWQSTLCALAVWALTLLVRRNRAGIRHALWMAASLKFLVPFASLIWVGQQVSWRSATVTIRSMGTAFFMPTPAGDPLSAPTVLFARALKAPAINDSSLVPIVGALWAVGVLVVCGRWAAQWTRIRRVAREGTIVAHGREVSLLRRLEQRTGAGRPLPVVMTSGSLEPGVFGVLRPVLLWPERLGERLDDAQIEAILAHELAHVRRRDNVSAAAHSVVQALLWCHPIVWWIGARLVDERERACDEHVVEQVAARETYAQSLLTTCRFSIEAPRCVAGVTGADLKRRIEGIMMGSGDVPLDRLRRLLFSTLGVSAIVTPLLIGVLNPPHVEARRLMLVQASDQGPSFEVASIKRNTETSAARRIMALPGGRVSVQNMTVADLVRFSYQIQQFQIVGGPDWYKADRFDINARAEREFPLTPPGTPGSGQLMMRSLLRDRFALRVRRETREMPIYALVMARRDGQPGPQLTVSTVDCAARAAAAMAPRRDAPPPAPPAQGERPACGMQVMPGRVQAGGFPLSQLGNVLSQQLQRIVVDRTGLTGNYDLDLTFTPDRIPAQAPDGANLGAIDPNGPSLFAALQEQLGLKLESTRGPVEVLVIDDVQSPTPD